MASFNGTLGIKMIDATYPPVMTNIASENGDFHSVSFPSKNGGSFHIVMLVDQRVSWLKSSLRCTPEAEYKPIRS